MEVHEKIRRPVRMISARCLYLFHPLTALVYLTVVFAIAFLYVHPAFVVAYTLLAFLQAGYFAGFGTVFQKLKMYVPFALLVAVINPFFNHRGVHILFYLFDKPITLEAFCYGFYMIFFLVSILLVFVTINHVLTSHKFLYLFSGIAPQTAFIVSMTLRFTEVLQKKAQDFLGVQNNRDISVSGKKLKIKRYGKLLGAFCIWALEDGMISSETLRAKEYGRHKRTHYRTYIFTIKDGICIVICLLFLIAFFYLCVNGAGEYDYFRNLTALSFDKLTMTAYGAVFIYMALPWTMDVVPAGIRRFFS